MKWQNSRKEQKNNVSRNEGSSEIAQRRTDIEKKIVNDPKNKHEKSKQDETEIKIFFFKKKDVREND